MSISRPTHDLALLHGGGQAGWIWDETVKALHQQGPDTLRVKAFDLPGCGHKRGQDISTVLVDGVIKTFIDELGASGLENIVLVGHSNAGTIMPKVAAARPDLVRKLVYVSCIAPAPGQTIHGLFGSGTRGGDDDQIGWPDVGEAGDIFARLRAMFCNDMTADQTTEFMAKLGKDAWPSQQTLAEDTAWRYDHLAAIPSTYIFCMRDQALPPRWQEVFADRFQVRRRIWLDAGHQVMNTRPQALAEVLLGEAGIAEAG